MILTDDQLKARNCLRDGSYLVDPKYLFPKERAIERFKERCRACWHLRQHFPEWVNEYIKSWSKEDAT